MSNIIIYGGGAFSPVRNHLSLCAMSFGTTAIWLKNRLPQANLRLTKMADSTSGMITNLDVVKDLNKYLSDPYTKTIIMSAALCDYNGVIGQIRSGSHAQRLQTREGNGGHSMQITPAPKVIDHIKRLRPDIKIIGFKTTTGKDVVTQVEYARRMDVDMVLANDTVTRENILVPQYYPPIYNTRENVLTQLVTYLNRSAVKFETDKEIWVQLDPNVYISKDSALALAGSFVTSTSRYFKHWHDQVEGLAIIGKGEQNV